MYNGILSGGGSLSGTHYFYTNPLEGVRKSVGESAEAPPAALAPDTLSPAERGALPGLLDRPFLRHRTGSPSSYTVRVKPISALTVSGSRSRRRRSTCGRAWSSSPFRPRAPSDSDKTCVAAKPRNDVSISSAGTRAQRRTASRWRSVIVGSAGTLSTADSWRRTASV